LCTVSAYPSRIVLIDAAEDTVTSQSESGRYSVKICDASLILSSTSEAAEDRSISISYSCFEVSG
jgi:hypothetical protein